MSITTDRTAPSAPVPAGKAAIADKVRAQLERDFPPGALAWVDDVSWRGPVTVPLSSLDWSRSSQWQSAKNPRKVNWFARRISAGWKKPVVLIRTPDGRTTPTDGHTRLLACRKLGVPVTAWVGYAKTNTGAWTTAHSKQK